MLRLTGTFHCVHCHRKWKSHANPTGPLSTKCLAYIVIASHSSMKNMLCNSQGLPIYWDFPVQFFSHEKVLVIAFIMFVGCRTWGSWQQITWLLQLLQNLQASIDPSQEQLHKLNASQTHLHTSLVSRTGPQCHLQYLLVIPVSMATCWDCLKSPANGIFLHL